jgi:hypothetical protein
VPLIAEPLAKLAASGLLDAEDPALAAEHLSVRPGFPGAYRRRYLEYEIPFVV